MEKRRDPDPHNNRGGSETLIVLLCVKDEEPEGCLLGHVCAGPGAPGAARDAGEPQAGHQLIHRLPGEVPQLHRGGWALQGEGVGRVAEEDCRCGEVAG